MKEVGGGGEGFQVVEGGTCSSLKEEGRKGEGAVLVAGAHSGAGC